MSGLLEEYDNATREWRKAKATADNWNTLRESYVYRLHKDGMSLTQLVREIEVERVQVCRMIKRVRAKLLEAGIKDA